MADVADAVQPTTDLDTAKRDLGEHGYCLLDGALAPERVRLLRDRLDELAQAEIADGTDYVYDNGANQRIWALLNKGDCFVELAMDPTALGLMEHLLGPDFLLSNIDANIAGPGGTPMFLHADQSFVPTPWPPFPLVANVMWMLDDFTPDNGATRITPRSHVSGEAPPLTYSDEHTLPVCGPAGTAMVFDGRLWHQTGSNVTTDQRRHGILAYYCRPFMRQQENWPASIDPAVLERWGRPLRHLLGFDIYLTLGMINGMPRDLPRY
jgi:ectoine hydroxylase-related dioxygenase (phytanoyl-CoA dioxygenase family)